MSFGLWTLMLILLNYYMFTELMWCLHDNKWFGSQEMYFKTHYKAKQAFLVTSCYSVLFHDVNITIWPLDRPIIAEFTKRFSMKTPLINILCL